MFDGFEKAHEKMKEMSQTIEDINFLKYVSNDVKVFRKMAKLKKYD